MSEPNLRPLLSRFIWEYMKRLEEHPDKSVQKWAKAMQNAYLQIGKGDENEQVNCSRQAYCWEQISKTDAYKALFHYCRRAKDNG